LPIFEISGEKVKKVARGEFANESELHKLVDDNLDEILGITFLASEYKIPNGRIDTLGIDEDGVPIIIEYKWGKDLSAIIQGLFYLDWIKQSKKSFELIVKDKIGKSRKVNWSVEPRLIIIAQSFNLKELSAINHVIPTVELMRYALDGKILSIENLNYTKRKEKTKPSSKDEDKVTYELEDVVRMSNSDVQEVFWKMREFIRGLSEEVREIVRAGYCDYRTTSTFASVNFQKNGLKIFIKVGKQECRDPQKLTKTVPSTYGYGKLSRVFTITNENQIESAVELIKQAYHFVSG